MRGEFIGVWSETWRELWKPLSDNSVFGDDFLPNLYRELVPEPSPPTAPPPPEDLTEDGQLIHEADILARDEYEIGLAYYNFELTRYENAVSGVQLDGKSFRDDVSTRIDSERAAVEALETAFEVVNSYDDDRYRNRYFQLVERFLEKYSLRYDLRRPFSLHPTLPGVFSKLFRELKNVTGRDVDLHPLMVDFEDAVRDLRSDPSSGKIKTCIQKQMNLLEAMGQQCPGVTGDTLGRICDEVGTWPHNKVKEAMKALYSFSNNYPGIRHGGTPASALRPLEMRDLVAITVLLAGFSPYLTDQINSETVYHET